MSTDSPESDQPVTECSTRSSGPRTLEEEQRERLVQTEQLKLLGDLARGVAHDLNQSLGLISGYSDLAIAAVNDPALDRGALLEMLEVVAQAATDGGQIVSRLLTFERGHPDGPAEDVSLAVLLVRVGQLTAPRWRDTTRAEGRPVTLYVDTEPDTVIRGWPTSLREALVNLVFNAVDAMPAGGIIRLRAHRQGPMIAAEVQDSGTGMSAEVQARAFQPLFTTKGPHGTGLGLPQVLSMVEQHGGRISIDSTLGKGTTFSLVFPAAHAATAGPEQQTNSLAVLVVDDEPALAELVSRMLRLDGHTVVVVHSGAAALERLSTEPFDVVVSDMGMPSMAEWEFTRQIRSRYPNTPVILASGTGSHITLEEAHERGIHAVVAKPYRRMDLQNALVTLSASPRSPVAATELHP